MYSRYRLSSTTCKQLAWFPGYNNYMLAYFNREPVLVNKMASLSHWSSVSITVLDINMCVIIRRTTCAPYWLTSLIIAKYIINNPSLA